MISTSYFITYLAIKRISIQEVTIQQLYLFALEYIQIESEVQGSNSGIAVQEAVTLQIILRVLQAGGDSGDIIFEGEVISKQYIFAILLLQNLTIENITYQKLYFIVYLYRVNTGLISLQNVVVPKNINGSLHQVLQYLRQYRENATGSITFNNKRISIHTIWVIIQTSGFSIEQVSVRYIWIAIQILTIGETVDPKQALYENVIEVLQAANQNRRIVLTINGKNITADILAQILGLSKEGAGKYDTSGLTVEEVWAAVTRYLGETETGTQGTVTETGSASSNNNSQAIYDSVIKVLQGANEGRKVVMTINGKNFTAETLAEILGLSKDSSGKYDTSGLTVSGVWTAIIRYLGGTETITQEVTESSSSSNVLQVFKSAVEQYNEGKKVSLRYDEQTIPVEDVIEKLGLTKDDNGNYNTDGVTEQQVIDALQSIVDNSNN